MNNRMRMYIRNKMESEDDYDQNENRRRNNPYGRRDENGRYMPRNVIPYADGREYETRRQREHMYMPTDEYQNRQIGFAAEDGWRYPVEADRVYQTTYPYPFGSETEHHFSGSYTMGMGEAKHTPRLSKQMAESWVEKMERAAGGEIIPLDRARELMEKHGIQLDPYEFWAVLNAVQSDYSKVFAKYGLGGNMDFLAEMAKAWICDADAVHEKAAAYFMHVVK